MAAEPRVGAPKAYTCVGGDIPSGSYTHVTVTGNCTVAVDATLTISGNLKVAAGAALDAQQAPATITIRGNVTAGSGSFVGLGCQPPSYTGNSAHECALAPAGHSTISVGGNVIVTNAATVMLNGIAVRGNVALTGGGAGPAPWSIKNNAITGNLTIGGQRTEWLGALFNSIGGNATLTDIALSDPHPGAPGVYIVRNTVGGNLTCTALTPGVSGGFVPGSVNVVRGNANGQCAALV
jgi:hypothetical protein